MTGYVGVMRLCMCRSNAQQCAEQVADLIADLIAHADADLIADVLADAFADVDSYTGDDIADLDAHSCCNI